VFPLANFSALTPAKQHMTVLALATLDGMTKSRNDPISVVLPKVANSSTIVTAACCFCWHFALKTLLECLFSRKSFVIIQFALLPWQICKITFFNFWHT
jgi:hypothetical protein